MSRDPTHRLNYSGNLEPVYERLCEAYEVGSPCDATVIDVGYDDCNVILDTDQGQFLAKMFAKFRSSDDISRYITTMQKAVRAGVRHPALFSTASGGVAHTDEGITLVLMEYIKGQTFFELDRAPDEAERKDLIEQAAIINEINHRPPFVFDSWAIPNIQAMRRTVQPFISPEDAALVEQAMSHYAAIPTGDLQHCFVHGDLSKMNVMKGDDGKVYVLDFSVSNWYPRILELAVIAGNLLYDPQQANRLQDSCDKVATEYNRVSSLAQDEEHLYAYTMAGIAMELMGSYEEKYINGHDTAETAYRLQLGRNGLRAALGK